MWTLHIFDDYHIATGPMQVQIVFTHDPQMWVKIPIATSQRPSPRAIDYTFSSQISSLPTLLAHKVQIHHQTTHEHVNEQDPGLRLLHSEPPREWLKDGLAWPKPSGSSL